MGFGGPHAAYFAFKDKDKRSAPGRIIGVSKTPKVIPPYAWHYKPVNNISAVKRPIQTFAQVKYSLANLAGMYAVYHRAVGLKRIATRIHA